ncbi:hypothetical protein RclHR1_01250013 [Rhizophagus clarus]|uniref:F-box domain-containing protein n=1 Tax=Rhizophagus clarus TaxID=94130 RepID=A0A2Z6Q7A2_9GLOM|nr:hypothetical protein RclHR1_01250013 [Rhizophagus clarus]
MACSKIFSGDIPEITSKIIQYLQNDFLALQSCIFVNRLWCRIAIPLLWEDPFSKKVKLPKNHNIIEISLHKLNDNDRARLNKYGINNELFSLNTLFNYPSFIKCLNTSAFVYSIKKWIKTLSINDQSTNISELLEYISLLLIKIFIQKKVNLHTFEVEVLNTLRNINGECLDSIIELILRNPTFIYDVKNLKLYFNGATLKLKFVKFFYTNCKSISTFCIQKGYNYYGKGLIEEYLSQIIQSQQNLKKISFEERTYPLTILMNPNCENTLKTIIFYKINFLDAYDLKKSFEQLNVLDSIHFIYCYSLYSKIAQINNLTKPFKLRSLFIDEIQTIDSLKLLLQKSGDYIENIGIKSMSHNLQHHVIQLIKINCTRIKYFELQEFDDKNISPAFELIENVKQNLNYIFIDFIRSDYDNKLSSIILQNLGQILPRRLEYLNLALKVNINDLENFLKNSRNTFVRKLLIKNKIYDDDDNDILSYIKEYIMKEKKVRYLAIEDVFSSGLTKNLFSLKNEVKEFQSYNIDVYNYNDLFIKNYDYIKEMD